MVKEFIDFQMEASTEVNGVIIKKMEKEFIFIPMEIHIREILQMALNMAKEFTNMQLDNFIKVNINSTSNMVLGELSSQTEINIQGGGKEINLVGREGTPLIKEIPSLVSSSLASIFLFKECNSSINNKKVK